MLLYIVVTLPNFLSCALTVWLSSTWISKLSQRHFFPRMAVKLLLLRENASRDLLFCHLAGISSDYELFKREICGRLLSWALFFKFCVSIPFYLLTLDLAISLSLANKIRQNDILSPIFKRPYGFLTGLLCLHPCWERNIPKQSFLEKNEKQVKLSHSSQVQPD